MVDADATDALVAVVRGLIDDPSKKTEATKAIYAHVRAVRVEAAGVARKLAVDVNEDDLGHETAYVLRKGLEWAATKIEKLSST